MVRVKLKMPAGLISPSLPLAGNTFKLGLLLVHLVYFALYGKRHAAAFQPFSNPTIVPVNRS
jgi:hypothetical protein